MEKKKSLELLLVVVLFSGWYMSSSFTNTHAEDINPTVFEIEQNPAFFEQLNMEYDGLLLTTCSNDMNQAYEVWMTLIKDIEQFSKDNGVNLKGVKMWLKVYWAEDGNIDYIAFNRKPQSANISSDALAFMLEDFRLQYKPTISNGTKFSHYGSASYPMRALPVFAH